MARSCAGIRTMSCGEWRTGLQVRGVDGVGSVDLGVLLGTGPQEWQQGVGTERTTRGKDSYGHCCGSLAWMASCVEKSGESFLSTFSSKHLHPCVCTCPFSHPVSMHSCPSFPPIAHALPFRPASMDPCTCCAPRGHPGAAVWCWTVLQGEVWRAVEAQVTINPFSCALMLSRFVDSGLKSEGTCGRRSGTGIWWAATHHSQVLRLKFTSTLWLGCVGEGC